MSHSPITECLCCGSVELKLTLDLKMQPPANMYLRQPRRDTPFFPLALNRCEKCWHSQLSWNVDRSIIFDDYAYVSGTSQTLSKFFQWFAVALKRTTGSSKRVLEIAANDGSLVSSLIEQGFDCVGVDPAKNIVESANEKGLPIKLGYWPAIASQINGKFDVIIGMNVLAHVDQPLEFLSACKGKLSTGGIIIIQPSQARMIPNGEFDTVYHEHVSFFNSNSISKLSERVGLKLVGTALVRVHGDSPVYFLMHDNEFVVPSFSAFADEEFGISEDLLDYEKRSGLFEEITYKKFAKTAIQVIDQLVDVVEEHRKIGFRIAFVGAAAKAITVLNAASIQPDFLLDESPLKIGLYAPGCNLVVDSLISVGEWDRPTLFIISAWNFRTELTKKLSDIGVPLGSKFYSYFPKPEWLSPSN
jgi:SAM-dependent methyltransferase